ncbi:unnamed protein product [Heterobilharzia americana]|nr:unnamed protein product [Heterobilharzia americana]CAH8540146.1 unnamed protein product [Heterobilharzia americana]
MLNVSRDRASVLIVDFHFNDPINQNFASANYYEVESTQVLVGSEKDIEDDNDNESDRNYCETCGRNFGTERAFTLHLRGVTHTQKTLQSTGVCAPDFTVQEESWEVKHREWLKSQYFIEPYSVVGLSGSFFCELCEVEFPSHKTLGSHLNGRRHRENVIIFESTGDRSLLKGKRKAPVKVTAKIQPFLDVCTQPLIGLNYMLEYQLQELDECLYICSLCNQWLPRKSVVKHLCSVVHRKAYLNTHYLPLFRIVDRDHSDKSLQTCRLEVYARKIEDFEGRKRLIIKEYSVKDLDLQSEIVRLIQEHNEARLMKKKEIENSPQSLCDQSISNTPVSADLEEGEIREDSSDEETTAIEEALGSPDSNSSFFTRYNVILKSIDKKRNSDTSDDTRKLNIKSQFVMGAIASGNKDVQLNGESMDETTITDDDCENYIMKLQQEGLLGLKASRSNGKMQKECTYVDHFTKEADWVLEKLKILKSKHEENLRRIAADVSAAARIKAAKLTNIENSTLHQYAIIHNSSFNHFVDELRYENSNLMLPSLGAPVGPSTPTRVNYNYPPPNIGNSNELRGNSGENNSRITLSSSAFNVILSAIDALKSSGHLPSGLNQSVKENNTMNTHINTSNQPVNTVDNRQLPFSSLNQVSRKPEQRMPEVSASTTSSITTMQYPNPPPTDVPRSTPVPVPSDREPVDSRAYSPQRAYRCTQNQAVTTSAYNWHMQNNPAFKPLIGAYEQQNEMHQSGSNGFKNDEKIFDAYTIFSKRSERKRAQKQSWIKTPKYFRRDLKNEANHGPTNTTQLNNMTGKRLSAIADFLGVNEPPTERKRIPSSNQLEKCSATTLPYPSYSSNNTQHQSALGHLPSFPESIRSPTMYTNQFSHRNTPLPYNNFMNVSGPSPSYAATSNSYPPTNLFTTPTHGSLWPIHVNSNFSASNAPQTLRLPQCSSSFFPR